MRDSEIDYIERMSRKISANRKKSSKMFYCIEYLMVDFPIRAMQRERDVDKCFENLKIYFI